MIDKAASGDKGTAGLPQDPVPIRGVNNLDHEILSTLIDTKAINFEAIGQTIGAVGAKSVFQDDGWIRWCGSDLLLMVEPFNYFVWRNSQCCAGNGDSGGAVFTSDGRFIGPIKFGDQPFVLNTFNSGGVPVYKFLHLVAEYMPSKTNAPAGGIPPDKAKAVTP